MRAWPRFVPLWPAGLFLLALLPRLYRLGAQSLWLDEGGTWVEVTGRSGKGWLALIAELWSPDAGYPLYHLLLKGWVALAGDSEWALRFPSALAGAVAAVAIYLAAGELERSGERSSGKRKAGDAAPIASDEATGRTPRRSAFALLPFALVALSPFALWHAQDAKAYSLLLLVVALELWALLRALRRGTRRAWLALLALVLVSVLVHRLALLAAAGVALALALARDEGRGRRGEGPRAVGGRWLWLAVAGACGALGVAGTILAARGEAAGVERVGVAPLAGVGLVLARFSLDRWPGDVAGYLGLPAAAWLAPFAVLGAWGLALLVRDAAARRPAAIALLCMLAAPLGLFALTLALTPVFQARYAAPAYPAWVLALCYPLLREQRAESGEGRARHMAPAAPALPLALICAVVAISLPVLVQPDKGLFSGAAVKEQWREAVAELAARVHPDDLVIVQPYYVLPMYDYYAPRVTPDPLPRPVTFPIFGEGDTGGAPDPTRDELREFVRRRYEPFFNQRARGASRALLLIAPDHAATVDPPPSPADTYGWLGLRFQYPQRTWPCGGAEWLGVALMCQSFPETFGAGKPPQPTTALAAVFGGELRLRGYTLSPHGGALRPGGTLPITLFWEAAAPPSRRYRMFLHLCRDCETPPLGGADGPPLEGYPPAGDTTTWQVGDPLHDERTVSLPRDLPPGRYTLLLGAYPEGAPTIEERLPVTSAARTLPGGRLVLGEVEISGKRKAENGERSTLAACDAHTASRARGKIRGDTPDGRRRGLGTRRMRRRRPFAQA